MTTTQAIKINQAKFAFRNHDTVIGYTNEIPRSILIAAVTMLEYYAQGILMPTAELKAAEKIIDKFFKARQAKATAMIKESKSK